MNAESNEVMALTKELTSDALGRWDDAKRREFVGLFDKRIQAARYILIQTAVVVWNKALSKQFVSAKYGRDINSTDATSFYRIGYGDKTRCLEADQYPSLLKLPKSALKRS
jgi:hypothetical protein